VLFEILPASAAQPQPVVGWQRAAAGVLLLLTLGSTLQFGLAANIGLLPKETLEWLANPANLNSDLLPPGLDTFDPVPFISSTSSVFMITLLPQVRQRRLWCGGGDVGWRGGAMTECGEVGLGDAAVSPGFVR
jgi:hypothetical protein